MITPKPRALEFSERLLPPLAEGPSVAANCFRGLGGPETVTVGTDGLGLGFDGVEELVIVNREETEYTTPWVELRQSRK